ncbi:alpha/beta-hydrolase [Lophiostoma macrostomum CBS 122681]|uniref:Alpha/beta-hydrolase n=1 Tax=Lophiostoma macrostomum CBS 122681 TaxID=1314788 RepID=A0A6A6TMH2_9PLEO|nr:alpha/beta-hydrolase [Lophiostoma macrostomum CBS 122681]
METAHTRRTFYVGGRYATNKAGHHVIKDQMYVERLTPVDGSTKPYPIILIHGFGQTGTNWLTKPDGQPGWASYFLSHGYDLHILDTPSRGRSPWTLPPHVNPSSWVQINAEVIQERFTASENYDRWPTAKAHTQWPSGYGKGVMGDPVFDAYFASTVPCSSDSLAQQLAVQEAGAALVEKVGKQVILMGHSNGAPALWLIADKRPDLIKAIVALEPAGPAFTDSFVFGGGSARPWGLTDAPMTYAPAVTDPTKELVKKEVPGRYSSDTYYLQADEPLPRQLVNLKGIKVVCVTTEASYHSMYDWVTVEFLRQAGVDVEWLDLKEKGVRGNGHMMMIEKNSDEVAEVVRGWIETVGSA